MNENPYLIFDFDGTLADTFDLAIAGFNQMADKYKFRKIQDNEVSELRYKSSLEILKFLKIPLLKTPLVVRKLRAYISDKLPTVSFYPEIKQVLMQLHEADISMGILTSNSEENVRTVLRDNGVEQCFNFVSSEHSFTGKAKLLTKIISAHNLSEQNLIYIGDETRDIEAAKQAGIECASVTWGFCRQETLENYQPNYLFNKPQQLLELVKEQVI